MTQTSHRANGTSECVTDAPPEHIHGLLQWLQDAGAQMDGLSFRRDCTGGVGAFASRAFFAGDALASVPRSCLLTVQVVKESPIGIAALAAAAEWQCTDICSEEVLVWIFMCIGRVDPSNFFHPYLASLPESSPGPTAWSEELREELRPTTLHQFIEDSRQTLKEIFDTFISRLPTRFPHLVPEGALASVDCLHWARGMCLSRAFFSTDLLPQIGNSDDPIDDIQNIGMWVGKDGKVHGVLLPLFDLLNHRRDEPIDWNVDGDRVCFCTGKDVCVGDEVFNDYGAKANEDLLFTHGFCIHPNPMDCVSLVLSMPDSSVGEMTPTRYTIRPCDRGGIGSDLWDAIAKLCAVHGTDHAKPKRRGTKKEHTPARNQMHVELLLLLLQRKYEALQAMEAEDERRLQCAVSISSGDAEQKRHFIAMYRHGQRAILVEALAILRSLLESSAKENKMAAKTKAKSKAKAKATGSTASRRSVKTRPAHSGALKTTMKKPARSC